MSIINVLVGCSLYHHASVIHSRSRPNVQPLLQERPAVADKPARRLRKVCTVYVRAVGL